MNRYRVIPEGGHEGKVQTVTAETHVHAAATGLKCELLEVERVSGWSGGPGTFRKLGDGSREVRVVRAER